jgi:predicted nucleotidyltransferase
MLADALSAQHLTLVAVVESGPRVWGALAAEAPSVLRGIYARPLLGYLALRKVPPCLTPDELPAAGLPAGSVVWDVQAVLERVAQSDPDVLAWLFSPQWLQDPHNLQPRLQGLADACCAPRALGHHYTELATRLFARHIARAEAPTASALFDVVRNTLAARWVIARGTPPPLPFAALLGGFSNPELNIWAQRTFTANTQPTDCPAFPDALREALLAELQAALFDCHALPGNRPDYDRLEACLRDVVLAAQAQNAPPF